MRKHPGRLLQWGGADACQCLQARVCGGGGRAKWRRQGGLWLYGHGGQGTGTARYLFEAAVLLVCTCPLVYPARCPYKREFLTVPSTVIPLPVRQGPLGPCGTSWFRFG